MLPSQGDAPGAGGEGQLKLHPRGRRGDGPVSPSLVATDVTVSASACSETSGWAGKRGLIGGHSKR